MTVVYYGVRKKLKVDRSLGVQICPNCGHQVEMGLAHESAYAHIFWIPIIPLGGWKVKMCPNCGIVEKLTGAGFKALKNDQ